MKKSEYSVYETHLTLFLVGLCCMMIHSLVDLKCYVLLRFLGTSSYDAQTISFFLRRFNFLVGIVTCFVVLNFGSSVACSGWHWLLFVLYLSCTFYIYMLVNHLVEVSKLALIPVFAVSVVSHGLFVSTINYIFDDGFTYYDRNSGLAALIFLCGCYCSGLMVKLLLKLSGDLTLTEEDGSSGLRLMNRLFILFTLITLACSFLVSRLPYCCENEVPGPRLPNPTLEKVLSSRSRWVFMVGGLGWAVSPMLNNLTLSVINLVSLVQALNLEYVQFMICLGITIGIYLLISTDVISVSTRTSHSETLYDIVCRILHVTNEANADLDIEDGIVEDLSSNQALNLRLFRSVQPWCYLQFGFWTEWENYDCIDHTRLMTLVSMSMFIAKLRGGSDFNNYPDDCLFPKTLQDQYLEILDVKYSLMWTICCFIRQANDVICTIPDILHSCCHPKTCCPQSSSGCSCACSGSAGGAVGGKGGSGVAGCNCNSSGSNGLNCDNTRSVCCLRCLRYCIENNNNAQCKCFTKCFQDVLKDFKGLGTGCYPCDLQYYATYRSFVYGILATCACEAKNLLERIAKSPDLDDGLKVEKSLELSLIVLEEFISKFLGILVYSRIADEFLLLFQQMRLMAINITKSVICFMCKCKCNGTCCKGDKKCSCLLYLKFIKCVCSLHKRHNEVCKIVLGMNKASLAETLPTLAMTRSVTLFSYFFGDFMSAPSMMEKATCTCGSSSQCPCCKFNSRIDDLLDLMLKGLEFLSEYDGVLALIMFFLSYFKPWKLDEIGSGSSTTSTCASTSPAPSTTCSCCCASGSAGPCGCNSGSSTCKCCICCLCCGDPKSCGCTTPEKKCCVCCVCCDKCTSTDGSCACCPAKTSGTCGCCNGQTTGECCGNCTTAGGKKCICCTGCSFNCCLCCIVCKKKREPTDNLVKLCENSKKNLELISSTRRTIIVQSVQDYVEKYNAFRDIYRNLNSALVGMRLSVLYMFFCLLTFILCVVGDIIPYVRNFSTIGRLTALFSVLSIVTAISNIYAFTYLSSLGSDSAVVINIMIITGLIICVCCSWIHQWITYRMLLYQQFEGFYKKIRVIYTGHMTLYLPSLSWWFEGFTSFVKSDLYTMYLLLTLKNLGEFYDPFSFGFTSKLKVKYDMEILPETVGVPYDYHNPHIISEREFFDRVNEVLLDVRNFGYDYDLRDLLDYRSFQYIPKDSYYFLTDVDEFARIPYSADMMFRAWCKNVRMTRLADRIQFLREHALRCVEDEVQQELRATSYVVGSIRKLKKYFDFRLGVLFDLADNCIYDFINHGEKFSMIDSVSLVRVFRLFYTARWSNYLNRTEEPKRPQREYCPIDRGVLWKKYTQWKIAKTQTCETVYANSLLCRGVVDKASEEFERVYQRSGKDPLEAFVDVMWRTGFPDRVSDDLVVTRYLSYVSKVGDFGEVAKVKSEISNLILRDAKSSKYFGSLLKGYLAVCKSLHRESTMIQFMTRNCEVVLGEWIRWQGKPITSDFVRLLSRFVVLDTSIVFNK